MQGFAQSLQNVPLTLIAHAATLQELRRVLTYPQLALDAQRQVDVLHRYQGSTTQPEMPVNFTAPLWALPESFPVCRDLDDQLFVALAFHTQATLVSKDRQVLKLRRRTRKSGPHIITVSELRSLVG